VPKFYGELQEASLENLSSDPSGTVAGKVWFNTTSVQVKTDDGTNKRALLRNDAKCVVGNHGTPANNIRLHRGASGVLQFVSGADATAEGSLSTSLNQVSSRIENYTDAGKPAAGNAGRVAWITDLSTALIDTGAAWQVLGSGGGGSSIKWEEDGQAPVRILENGVGCYVFPDAIDQYLYTAIRVPTSYAAGRQIFLKILVYDIGASGTGLLQTLATLVRPGTDAISATTNQHTSTNAAVTLGSEPDAVNCDLTDASGLINGVAVAAGSLILVRLTRAYGSDTGTGDIRFIEQSTEVTFA
jgi:hypothetical protein